jgi:hypothetical protein
MAHGRPFVATASDLAYTDEGASTVITGEKD